MNLKDLVRQFIATQTSFWSDLKDKRYIHTLNRDFNHLYKEVRKNAAPIFVLSTGRCGTMLLTEILRSSKYLVPVHEPFPELSYHSALAFEEPQKNNGHKAAIDTARYESIRNAYLLDKRYVETNNRITFFAYYLAELYPEAKFIHLVRNPKHFIESGVLREWYSGKNLFDEGRIRDEQLFKTFNHHQRIAWLWAQTNQFSEEFSQAHPKKCFLLRSEDLFRGSKEVVEVLRSLGINDISEDVIQNNVKTKVNQSKIRLSSISNHSVKDVSHFFELKDLYGYD